MPYRYTLQRFIAELLVLLATFPAVFILGRFDLLDDRRLRGRYDFVADGR